MRLFVALLLAGAPAWCAIAFDNSADLGNNGGSTSSYTTANYTVGAGSNMALVIDLTGDTASDNITGVTWNGNALTLINKRQGTRWNYAYILLNAPSGTGTVTVTAGTAHYLIVVAASYSGVGSVDNNGTFTSATSPVSASLTPIANNCWVLATTWSFSSVVASTNTLVRQRDTAFASDAVVESSLNPISPAASTTLTWTYSAGQTASGVIFSLAPSGGGGGGGAVLHQLLTLGVGK